jgi:hypothetical protein
MAWITPKTDWYGGVNSNGEYEGDKFNADDYNRIKNNIQYLKTISEDMYNAYSITAMGSDKTVTDYPYAKEINAIEDNLDTINRNTLKRSLGDKKTYYSNGQTIDYIELNRIERGIQELYNLLINQYQGRRSFTWNFGMNGGL